MSYEEAYSDSLRVAHAFIAQLVERFVYTEDVGGSSPSGGTNGESHWFLAVLSLHQHPIYRYGVAVGFPVATNGICRLHKNEEMPVRLWYGELSGTGTGCTTIVGAVGSDIP